MGLYPQTRFFFDTLQFYKGLIKEVNKHERLISQQGFLGYTQSTYKFNHASNFHPLQTSPYSKHLRLQNQKRQENGEFILNYNPKDHWTLKTGYFEDPTPALQVQTLPLEGPGDP